VAWRAALRADGRRVTATLPSEGAAKAWLAEQEYSLGRGTFVDPRDGDTLFADWVKVWWSGRDALFAPGSLKADRSRLKKHLLPAFGQRGLAEIRPSQVQQWVNGLTGAGLSGKTVRECHALLGQILNSAIDERLISVSPCRSPSGQRSTRLPRKERHDPVALSPEQLRALIEAHPPHYRPLVVTFAATALRWSEAAGLTVRHLDLVGHSLRVRRTYNEANGWRTLAKSNAGWRTVTFPASVALLLAPLVEGKSLDDPVFTTPPSRSDRGGRLLHHGNFIPRIWEPAVERVGLAHIHPTPHDLRHTHASLLAAAGLLPVAQARLGHAKQSTTADIYTHALPGADEAALAIIELALTGVPDTAEGILSHDG
jgi:integrase